MSAPNSSYDPVEVAALQPDALAAAIEAATAAFAAAADLEALKAARLAHLDKGAVAAARREIGALPPSAKAEAGKRVGAAMDAVRTAYEAREAHLQEQAAERILVEERVDVTVPTGRRPVGARHPVELTQERLMDIFVAQGWEVAEGPEVESEWMNFDALNLGKDHPAPHRRPRRHAHAGLPPDRVAGCRQGADDGALARVDRPLRPGHVR